MTNKKKPRKVKKKKLGKRAHGCNRHSRQCNSFTPLQSMEREVSLMRKDALPQKPKAVLEPIMET